MFRNKLSTNWVNNSSEESIIMPTTKWRDSVQWLISGMSYISNKFYLKCEQKQASENATLYGPMASCFHLFEQAFKYLMV